MRIACLMWWWSSYCLADILKCSNSWLQREWVCEKSSYAPTAQALFFMGSLIGSGFFGWMGDKLGRVPALIGLLPVQSGLFN